ncbi:hypothetical protein BBJ28_00003601 [Nothophytophthora sp. Chile5]|nr:hypothetical protein BBJ28_00003601 [Nothophytophthora sp. Chile5]
MVAGSITSTTSSSGLGLTASPAANGLNKCRYKTGKCTNTRSSKRNGQPHQLCLYHRDKANKIQRKFDRQKRQVARVNKTRAGATSPSSISVLAESVGSPSGSSVSSPSSFAALAARDVDMYSDSDCSRFSLDSDAGSTGLSESVWQELPAVAASFFGGDFPDVPLAVTAAGCHRSYLSSDEIDFLCSAILE